jgi:hypothetical protein
MQFARHHRQRFLGGGAQVGRLFGLGKNSS